MSPFVSGYTGGAEPPTRDLLQDAQKGDAAALERLLARYQDRVLAAVRRRMGADLRTWLESQDVMQEVMVQAVDSLHRGSPRGGIEFYGWLCAITENRLRNLARTRRRRSNLTGDSSLMRRVEAPPAETVLEIEERALHEHEVVERALRMLAPDHARVIRLRNYLGMSFRDVGARMDRSDAAAGELHKRAKLKLVKKVAELERRGRSE
ncbi:MAG TPA: sigma-70 family RNA polymerase sigma factor [Planctomycetota bacterium]